MSSPAPRRESSRTVRISISGDGGESAAPYVHYLILDGANDASGAIELASDRRLTIGRGAAADHQISDPGASSLHAMLGIDGTRVVVTDLGSTNGTFLDGKRISGPTELPIGARLQIGRTILRHELRSREEIDRQSRVAEELAAARRYVEALLPEPRTRGPVRIDWTFIPCAALAGDAFGTIDIDADAVGIFLIDVAGHGARSALHSVSVVNILRNRSLPHADLRDPAAVLARLNDVFPMEQHDGLFFTMWYGVYDSRSRRLTYGTAGHPAALLREPGAAPLQALKTPGPPIGAFENASFVGATIDIVPGSRLYVFSDGVYEIVAKDGRNWSQVDFAQAVTDGRTPGTRESRHLYEAVLGASRTEHLDDDFSLLIAEFSQESSEASTEI